MADGIYAVASGAIAQSQMMDVIANNLANANSTGFKGDRVAFFEMLARTQDGTDNETQRQVRLDAVETNWTRGALRHTGSALDMAIMGDGFFEVQTPAGETRYTRAGSFILSAERKVIMPSGSILQGAGGAIEVPEGQEIRIMPSGKVSAIDAQQNISDLGKIKVTQFENRDRLERAGEGLWIALDGAAPQALENVFLQPNTIELANISPVRQMTQLVRVSRYYDALHRGIQTFSDLNGRTASSLGK